MRPATRVRTAGAVADGSGIDLPRSPERGQVPEPCSWLATGQRVLLLGETGRHSLDVYRSAEDDRDWRVMVPMARAESDPCLAWVRAATSACHGPGGIDAYLIPMHLWRRTVSVTGRYLG